MQDFLPLIYGPAGALVVLAILVWALATGRLHSDREFSKLEAENAALKAENDQIRAARDTERRTVNEMAQAGQVTNQLITALTAIASEKAAAPQSAPPQGLTAGGAGP